MERSFRLDRTNSRIMGVCSGLSLRYGMDTTLIRIIAVLSLFAIGPVTLLAYFLAGWMAD